jgi:hypothetical protein
MTRNSQWGQLGAQIRSEQTDEKKGRDWPKSKEEMPASLTILLAFL